MSDETVVDVLEELDDWTDVERLRQRASEDYPNSPMTREDWLQPLKLTGGRVCLKVSHDWFSGFVTVDRGDRLVYRMGGKSPFTVYGVEAVGTFQSTLDAGLDIEPVLREETPFEEVQHG